MLTHNKNSFSFEFTALSFFAPEKNQYSFMLEGFDKNWNNTGKERRATYTNIPPGNYVFRIKASNNDGIWNNEGYALRLGSSTCEALQLQDQSVFFGNLKV